MSNERIFVPWPVVELGDGRKPRDDLVLRTAQEEDRGVCTRSVEPKYRIVRCGVHSSLARIVGSSSITEMLYVR